MPALLFMEDSKFGVPSRPVSPLELPMLGCHGVPANACLPRAVGLGSLCTPQVGKEAESPRLGGPVLRTCSACLSGIRKWELVCHPQISQTLTISLNSLPSFPAGLALLTPTNSFLRCSLLSHWGLILLGMILGGSLSCPTQKENELHR